MMKKNFITNNRIIVLNHSFRTRNRTLLSLANFNCLLLYHHYTPLLKFTERKYITLEANGRSQNKLGNILNRINLEGFHSNTIDTQIRIEMTLYKSYEDIFKKVILNPRKIVGINVDLIGPSLSKYVDKRKHNLETYVSNLISIESKYPLENLVIKSMDKAYIINHCLVAFLSVYAHQYDDNYKQNVLTPFMIRIGEKIVNDYFTILKNEYNHFKEDKDRVTFSKFRENWKISNPELANELDNKLYARIGGKIIDLLEFSEFITKNIHLNEEKNTEYIVEIHSPNEISKSDKRFVLPTKLPMVVKPKPYSYNKLGGYILNDDKYSESLLIDKAAYKISSTINKYNSIYDMVNSISSTPYKINKAVLEYINRKGIEQGIILDVKVQHELEKLEVLRPLQKRKLASYNSSKLLQETILDIADFYSKFDRFYFPVRLDQRGRVYCTPNYFNYQSNELSKALLQFADPGTILKTDDNSIKYLISYGVNCFGGIISKQSLANKIEWVEKNKDNILDYDNGILLGKASNKLLFLAFCIEYKRYIEFMGDENQNEFHTYLPIQLDATCNGFQHMALLSNEKILFKQLNLIKKDSKDSPPNDFYNFLLHKVVNVFSEKLGHNITTDEKTDGSYERLNNFMWNRSYIKKAVMTIPYNASSRAMVGYIKDGLFIVDCKKDDATWYSDTDKNTKLCINHKDIQLLVNIIRRIVLEDFRNIKSLIKYLRNISSLLNSLNLPIVWNLPTGLTVHQSYLQTKSTTITPFIYSKSKISLKVTKNCYDKNKQMRALMPNLIHSLDGSSMSLLYKQFSSYYSKTHTQFFSIHDCFGTTFDKVVVLKTVLASVYIDIYSSDQYLIGFDNFILDYISKQVDYKLDKEKRIIELPDGAYQIQDVDWVKNKPLSKIDPENILI